MSTAKRRGAWIALYALAMQLLLPLVAPLPAMAGAAAAEIVLCTPEGMKTVDGGNLPAHGADTTVCPRCDGILHAPVIPAPPAALPTRLALAERLDAVPGTVQAPRVETAPAFARGPPA